jgi:glyoxylase-like metal-dependent hydrolase (beta-lactamase superfamily II)
MHAGDQPNYDGNVQVGGPAQTRSLSGVSITKLAVGPYANNSYLLRSANGHTILIDAAAEPDRLLELIGEQRLDAILTTHSHADHWQALDAVREATGARTFAGRLDAPDIPVATDVPLEGGELIEVGDLRLRAVHLSGHTPGSIAVILDDPEGDPHVFTGDCLFPGGVGKTWDDPERFASLFDGVKAELFDTLPDNAWVYPGHGADTTLGAERPHLEEWRQRGW